MTNLSLLVNEVSSIMEEKLSKSEAVDAILALESNDRMHDKKTVTTFYEGLENIKLIGFKIDSSLIGSAICHFINSGRNKDFGFEIIIRVLTFLKTINLENDLEIRKLIWLTNPTPFQFVEGYGILENNDLQNERDILLRMMGYSLDNNPEKLVEAYLGLKELGLEKNKHARNLVFPQKQVNYSLFPNQDNMIDIDHILVSLKMVQAIASFKAKQIPLDDDFAICLQYSADPDMTANRFIQALSSTSQQEDEKEITFEQVILKFKSAQLKIDDKLLKQITFRLNDQMVIPRNKKEDIDLLFKKLTLLKTLNFENDFEIRDNFLTFDRFTDETSVKEFIEAYETLKLHQFHKRDTVLVIAAKSCANGVLNFIQAHTLLRNNQLENDEQARALVNRKDIDPMKSAEAIISLKEANFIIDKDFFQCLIKAEKPSLYAERIIKAFALFAEARIEIDPSIRKILIYSENCTSQAMTLIHFISWLKNQEVAKYSDSREQLFILSKCYCSFGPYSWNLNIITNALRNIFSKFSSTQLQDANLREIIFKFATGWTEDFFNFVDRVRNLEKLIDILFKAEVEIKNSHLVRLISLAHGRLEPKDLDKTKLVDMLLISSSEKEEKMEASPKELISAISPNLSSECPLDNESSFLFAKRIFSSLKLFAEAGIKIDSSIREYLLFLKNPELQAPALIHFISWAKNIEAAKYSDFRKELFKLTNTYAQFPKILENVTNGLSKIFAKFSSDQLKNDYLRERIFVISSEWTSINISAKVEEIVQSIDILLKAGVTTHSFQFQAIISSDQCVEEANIYVRKYSEIANTSLICSSENKEKNEKKSEHLLTVTSNVNEETPINPKTFKEEAKDDNLDLTALKQKQVVTMEWVMEDSYSSWCSRLFKLANETDTTELGLVDTLASASASRASTKN